VLEKTRHSRAVLSAEAGKKPLSCCAGGRRVDSEALEARVAELLLRRHFGPARLARYESEDGERKEGELGLWYRSMIP
jgi:hypothetical protein